MRKMISNGIKGTIRAMGRRLTSVGNRLSGQATPPTWEDRAVRDARNMIRLAGEIAEERRAAAAAGDYGSMAEFDESLAYMQHSVTKVLRDILGQQDHRLFSEALGCILAVSDRLAEARDLAGYASRLRSRIGPVEWNTVRASAYAEVAEGMKLGTLGAARRMLAPPSAPVAPQVESDAPPIPRHPEPTAEDYAAVEVYIPEMETEMDIDPVAEAARQAARNEAHAGIANAMEFGPYIY